MGKNKYIKVGSVYYPDTKEWRERAKDAFKWRYKGWITEKRKRLKNGRHRILDRNHRS